MAYSISKTTEEAAIFATYLKAQLAPWSNVGGTYDLDFGQAVPYQTPQQLKDRSFLGDTRSTTEGPVNFSKSVTFGVGAGEQGQRINICADNDHILLRGASVDYLVLDGISCFVTRSFEVTGHISVQKFRLQDLVLTASPQNFVAELKLEANTTASDQSTSLQHTKELFAFPTIDAEMRWMASSTLEPHCPTM